MDAISGIRTTVPDFSRVTEPSDGRMSSDGFSRTLANAMQQVDTLRTDAQQQISSVLAGNGAELHTATIAVEKADVAFQLMMQVRNKIVAAYQEVAHLQF
jgi:flagellar hook-basal body complex protein FliE